MQNCPLCYSHKSELFFENKVREFYLCDNCHLIFVPKKFHLSPTAEKYEYDLHDNDVNDVSYRKFLKRLAEPALGKLRKLGQFNNSKIPKGLDFGCGFAPALVAIFEKNGCEMAKFDKFYFNNQEVFKNNYYDFITTTEVVEHLSNPMHEFECLWDCLNKNNSFLALMTKLVNEKAFRDKNIFANWHYIRDLTHICFYSKRTCEYIAQRLSLRYYNVADAIHLDFIGNDIVIFQ